jgi:cyclic pyranopterin phosphate synthase
MSVNSFPASAVRDTLPQVVEIEVSRHCNRRCAYCPQSFDWYRGEERFMPLALFRSIVEQLGAMAFSGRLSFHLYNEPLLRPDLADLVALARASLPLGYFVLYTNGDLLTDLRYASLLEAGIDSFFVTRHSSKPLPVRPYQTVRYPGEFPMSSRGALVDGVPGASSLPCYAAHEMLIIRHDGQVVLCHEDATSRQPMGDLNRQSVAEVWTGQEFARFRKLLGRGKRKAACGLCGQCDNRLHPLPDTAI